MDDRGKRPRIDLERSPAEDSDEEDEAERGTVPRDNGPSFAEENGLRELSGRNGYHKSLKKWLLFRLRLICKCEVVSVHVNRFRGENRQAKREAFHALTKAVARKHGFRNVKVGWCVVRRDEIRDILEYGFKGPTDSDLYGRGLYLVSNANVHACVTELAADGDGMKFLLLCRVILGKSELVGPYPARSCPTSPEFDSGVDNLMSPRTFIVWSTHMNTHVLPMTVVCIKTPASFESLMFLPVSPKPIIVSLSDLLSESSKSISPEKMKLVTMHCNDMRAGKIWRSEMLRRIKRVIGEELMIQILRRVKFTIYRADSHRNEVE